MIRARALELLARREHSARELAEKLRLRGYESGLVAEVIGALQAEGFQSDARFTETYVRHRIDKGYGPLRITQELAQRGVADAMIEENLERLAPDWPERIALVHRKKFGAAPPDGLREKGRRARFLHQRGFSSEQIHRLMRRLEAGD